MTVELDDMGVVTRSIANEDAANYCDDLWVGLYSKETGELVDSFYKTDVAQHDEAAGKKYNLVFETESRNEVYVVAVSNTKVNFAVDEVGNYTSAGGNVLYEELQNADTFEKFKKLCVLRPDANDVNIYANSLTMSGWYADDSPSTTGDINISTIKAINISPGVTKYDGAVYLRRVISYNKFIIVPGDYITLTLNNWKVCNIPAGSYLVERGASDNVSDSYSGTDPFYNSSKISHVFTATENSEGKEGKSFEFYQMENKHTAVNIDESASDFYNEREKEYKDDSDQNTGVYKSLVATNDPTDPNNNASYVVINASLDYYIAATDDPDKALPVDPEDETITKVHRTANVNYTIHLGYCEDKDDNGNVTVNTAKDFNCRRNTKYTYNVTINGVKNVVVEAVKEGDEPQPGVEGWVSDETGDYEELDSHYCEFNISLTDAERDSLGFSITAPYDNTTYTYTLKPNGTENKSDDGMSEQLYDWVKFYPTTDEKVLAKYNGGSDLWSLRDMCGVDKKENTVMEGDKDTPKWYTVFVNEYVYTFDDQEGAAETSWPKYVNKDDRIIQFIMNHNVSKDKESSYSYCKYAFGQKSIQTYYNGTPSSGENTAIGIEHVEETYCLNMSWNYLIGKYDWNLNKEIERDTTEYDYINGRYNIYHYLEKKQITDWDAVIQETLPAHVMGGSNAGCSHPDADYPVYMPMYTPGLGRPDNYPTPGDTKVYYANSICMNRNRDLNGNGKIDTEEIRWYMPTSSVYIQIAMAQGELPDPIIKFTDYDPNYFWTLNPNASYDRVGTYNFHYITSDYQYYWAEQAVSTGDNVWDGYSSERSQAYTVRCIRNLGTNPKLEPVKGNPGVANAFSHDRTNRTLIMDNFTDETIRGYNYGGIAPHDLSSPSARTYKKFQYAENLLQNKSDDYLSIGGGDMSTSASSAWIARWTNSLKENGLCGQYYEKSDKSDLGEWRIPTAYEIALMWIENLPQADNAYFLSSTSAYFVDYDLRNEAENNKKYLGYNNYWNRHVVAMDVMNSGIRIRCVRDVR
jgi:hypothetical protein